MLHPDYQYTPLLVTAMASMGPMTSTMWCWVRASRGTLCAEHALYKYVSTAC